MIFLGIILLLVADRTRAPVGGERAGTRAQPWLAGERGSRPGAPRTVNP